MPYVLIIFIPHHFYDLNIALSAVIGQGKRGNERDEPSGEKEFQGRCCDKLRPADLG